MNDMIFICTFCRGVQEQTSCSCKCKLCGGRGNTGKPQPCDRCGSTGSVRSFFGRVKQCSNCRGQKERCQVCAGSGKDPECPKCGGTGKLACAKCRGKGFIDIETALSELTVVPNSFRLFHAGVDDYTDSFGMMPCEVRSVESVYQQLRLAFRVDAGKSLKQVFLGRNAYVKVGASSIELGISGSHSKCTLFSIGPRKYVITVMDGSGVRDGTANR
jgi:hypothetical protein